jgi:hypothetical protein
VSCHKSPADDEVGSADCDFAPPDGLKAEPSYTFNWFVFVSNHNSPFSGDDGADVPDEFSRSFTRFSLRPSPNPEKLLQKVVQMLYYLLYHL